MKGGEKKREREGKWGSKAFYSFFIGAVFFIYLSRVNELYPLPILIKTLMVGQSDDI